MNHTPYAMILPLRAWILEIPPFLKGGEGGFFRGEGRMNDV